MPKIKIGRKVLDIDSSYYVRAHKNLMIDTGFRSYITIEKTSNGNRVAMAKLSYTQFRDFMKKGILQEGITLLNQVTKEPSGYIKYLFNIEKLEQEAYNPDLLQLYHYTYNDSWKDMPFILRIYDATVTNTTYTLWRNNEPSNDKVSKESIGKIIHHRWSSTFENIEVYLTERNDDLAKELITNYINHSFEEITNQYKRKETAYNRAISVITASNLIVK